MKVEVEGTIYKLFCKTTNDCYVGSTIDFNNRKKQHKQDYYFSNSKLYKFIRENNGFDNFEYEILEKKTYPGILTMREREREFFELLNPTLNTNCPTRTYVEHLQIQRQYRKNNKDKINEKNKEKVFCKVCDCNVSRGHLSAHKKSKKHIKNLNKS